MASAHLSLSRIEFGVWAATTGLCSQEEGLANQLKANFGLTVKPLFSVALQALINSF
jgi:hypothetical protein